MKFFADGNGSTIPPCVETPKTKSIGALVGEPAQHWTPEVYRLARQIKEAMDVVRVRGDYDSELAIERLNLDEQICFYEALEERSTYDGEIRRRPIGGDL